MSMTLNDPEQYLDTKTEKGLRKHWMTDKIADMMEVKEM